ncbi:MAG: DEAD/DEAH box helicase [Lachnospira sp.]
MKFNELNIDERIIRAIDDCGFEEASPIQAQAIPVICNGQDVVGQAQTGTGKTAAYTIPMLQRIDPSVKKPQAIVLCPTRELAIQVAEEIRKLAKYMSDIKVLPVYGGQEIVRQIKSLKTGVQIIVGTPGRVMDHMRRKTVRFDSVSFVVLDEADEMLDMGFREDMETILTDTPKTRQTVMFSATMSKEIMALTGNFQKNATTIKVVRKELTVENIEQYYYEVRPKNKTEVLCRLIDIYNPKLSVVFCNTKRQVDELISELKGRGYSADGIHGDLKQQQRDRVMDDFRSGNIDILLATDVAARGIDVDDVDVVFNYDLPQDEEYYVHRIGRTGRAGRNGLALTLVSGKEVYKLKSIEHYCKTKIIAKSVPSLDDVNNTKIENLFSQIRDIIKEDGLSSMIELVEKHINEDDMTAMDVAAALLKLQVGDTFSREDDVEEFHYDVDNDDRRMVRLFINIGKKDKIQPANILGAIAGESGMPGRLVGAIDMMDNYTFVDVPASQAEKVLRAMNDNVQIKGRTVNVEMANVKPKARRGARKAGKEESVVKGKFKSKDRMKDRSKEKTKDKPKEKPADKKKIVLKKDGTIAKVRKK